MVDARDGSGLAHRLDAVEARILALGRRLEAVEAGAIALGAPSRPAAVALGTAHDAPSASATVSAPIVTAAAPAPMLPMAVAGGGALLLGLGFFAWHAMEQGWMGAGTRLILGAAVAVGLTAAAVPLARRGHAAVAGAVSGAGLGAWFSAWLLARFAHDLASAPQAFVALAMAAVACLGLAGRLRLRLMAGLACAAACATPVLTHAGADRLAELMAYQLAVMVLLGFLDKWRGWPELPTMGLLGTWALAIGWATTHLGPHNVVAFTAWGGVLVVATAASSWRVVLAVSTTRGECVHLGARLLVTGVAAWGSAAWALEFDHAAIGIATAMLALWHGGLALLFLRRGASQLARVATWLAWAQAAVVPLWILDGVWAATGWAAMALFALVLTRTRARAAGARLLVLPTGCAIAWATTNAGAEWAWPAAAAAAVIPLTAGLWLGRDREIRDATVALGSVAWVLGVLGTAPGVQPTQLAWAVVPALVTTVAALVRPGHKLARLAVRHLVVACIGAVGVLLGTGALKPGPLPWLLLGIVVALATATVAVLVRTPRREAHAEAGDSVELGGYLTAVLVGAALAVVAPRLVPTFVAVGRTTAIALTGLGLVVAGLRIDHHGWRRTGLVAIGVAAAKIVVFDIGGATVAGRALGFVGIGTVLIAGAFAYSRARHRGSTPEADGGSQ